MNAELLTAMMEDSMIEGNIDKFNESLDLMLNSFSIEDVSQTISLIIKNQYTRHKADYLAKFMEIAIKRNINLAITNHPDNFLLRAALVTGSMDLYNCYIEAGVQPFLSLVVAEEHEDHYIELFGVSTKWSDLLFPNYVECVKGLDYNGAFGISEDNENAVLINREDYELLEDVVEKYNTIIGRRDIIKDLSKRAGLE